MIVSLLIALPFLWMVSTSFKSPAEVNRRLPTIIPETPVTGNYVDAFVRASFGKYFMNTIVVGFSTTLIAIGLAALSGYALSTFRLPGGKALLLAILATTMFPGILLLIPLYTVMRELGLIDTRVSLIIVYTSFALPFSVWMLRNYFLTIPRDLDEAALVDGCSRVGALWRVMLPMALPGIAATAIFSLILAWDEFLYANTFINSSDKRTLSVGLASLRGEFSTDWGLLMAGTVITTVPVAILFIFLQRHLTNIWGGGVKE